jgi:signal peptidase II
MIKYGDWFVGNVADIAIVGSAVVFMVLSLLGKRPLVTEASPEPIATADAAATEDATS